ncbi:MAG: histidinol-phosphatase HisJ family protein [Opitutales bacterium]|nr:histidinol-phosphatase HisJ family protein [Opitutales bacterium]MCH8539561.1 histidinol-phosphatase HisJ family protein [Opitutales bacterium]
MKPSLFDSHMHTPLCGHAQGELSDYADEACRKGLDGIIFTCHTPLPDGMSAEVRMKAEELPEYVDRVAQCRAEFKGRCDVRLGLEVDFVPGYESALEKIIESQPFDYIIGSVHPHLPEIRDAFWKEDPIAYGKTYFDLQARAAETGLFDTIAHPDVLKIVRWADYDKALMKEEFARFLDRVAETGVCLECNTSGLIRKVQEIHPAPDLLPMIAERGIPVVIGSDAHDPLRVGDGFREGVEALAEAGFKELLVFTERQSQSVPLDSWKALVADWSYCLQNEAPASLHGG